MAGILFMFMVNLVFFVFHVYAGTWLILIDEGTYKEGINNIGDVVEIYNNPALPSGVGYENFKCVEIPYMTAEQVRDVFTNKMPEMKRAWKSKAKADEWGFDQPEEAEFWKDGDDWKQIVDSPKYQINVSDVKTIESSLTAAKDLTERTSAILDNITANVATDTDNQTIKYELSTLEASK